MTATVYKLSNNPIKAAAFTFDACLFSQADTKLVKTDPTLAAGDIVIYKDGVLDGNIDSLPADIGSSGIIPFALSADEMDADRLVIWCHDVAGAEWCDAIFTLSTVQAVVVAAAGDAMDLIDEAVDAGAVKADAVTEIQGGLATGAEIAALNDLSAAAVTAAVPTALQIATQTDTTLSAAHGSGSWGSASGSGAETFVYTVTDDDTGLPIGQTLVWVTTDEEGNNIIGSGYTDDFGNVTFYLDAGTNYFWRKKAGYNFTNPDAETVT
jgi:hypothetical protein